MSEGKISPPTFNLKSMKRCLFFLALGFYFFSRLFGQSASLHYGKVNTDNRIVFKTIPNAMIPIALRLWDSAACWVIDGTDTAEYFAFARDFSSRTDSLVILGDVRSIQEIHNSHEDTGYYDLRIKSIDIQNHSVFRALWVGLSDNDLESISIRNCPSFSYISLWRGLYSLRSLKLQTDSDIQMAYILCTPGTLNISDCNMTDMIVSSNIASMIDFSAFSNLQYISIAKYRKDDPDMTPCFIDDIFRSLPTVSNGVILFFDRTIPSFHQADSAALSTCRDTIAFNKGWSLSYLGHYEHIPNTYYSCQSDPSLLPDLTNKVSLGVIPNQRIQLVGTSEQPIWVVNGNDTIKRYCTIGKKTAFSFRALSDSVHVLGNASALQLGWNGEHLSDIRSNGHATLEKLDLRNNNFSRLDLSAFPRLKTLDVRSNVLNSLSVIRHPGLEFLDISFNPLSSLLLDNVPNLKILKANHCHLSDVNLGNLRSLQKIDLTHNILTHITVDSASHLDSLYLQGNQLDACALDSLFSLLPRRATGQPQGAIYVAKNEASNTDIFGCRTYIARNKRWNVYKDETVLNNRDFTCAASAPIPNWVNCIRLKTYVNNTLHFILRGFSNQTLAIVNGPDTIRIFCLDWSEKHIDLQTQSDTVYIYGDLASMNLLDAGYTVLVTEIYIPEHTALEHLYMYKTGLKTMDIRHCTRLSRIDAADNHLRSVYFDVCPSLKHVLLMKNELSACGLDSVFHKIPRREAADNSKIFIDDNPGSETCRDTLASHKNWSVLTTSGRKYSNTEYLCDEFFMSLGTVSAPQGSIYPNPVESGGEFWVFAPQGSVLSLWNMQGICVWTGVAADNATAIQAPSQSGVYVLKIQPYHQHPSAVKVVVK